jgi:hypothetical protein
MKTTSRRWGEADEQERPTPEEQEPTSQPAAGFFCLDATTNSRPGMFTAAGRLSPQEIALRAAELSGATGVGSDGIAVWEKVD